MAIIILLLAIGISLNIIERLFNHWPFLTKLGGSVILGILGLGTIFFVLYAFARPIFNLPWLILASFLLVFLLMLWRQRKIIASRLENISPAEVIFAGTFLLFSLWLMFHSFSVDEKKGIIGVGSHLWSDYGSHVALMRSFSLGDNFPPQFPLFPGENIRYHFMLYFLAGALERLGANLGLALNLVSGLSFWAMGILLLSLGRKLFPGGVVVGMVAVLLTILNSSLVFIEFFQKNSPLEWETYRRLITNHSFLANAPYDPASEITTFWHLNIYLNQRHLPFAFAVGMFVLLVFLELFEQKNGLGSTQMLLVIIMTALLPFWHSQVFLMILVMVGVLALIHFRKEIIWQLAIFFLAVIFLGFGQIFWMYNLTPEVLWRNFLCPFFNCGTTKTKAIVEFFPGYLLPRPISLASFLDWWWKNLGLTLLLLVDAIRLSPRPARLFYLSVVPLFFLGFSFRFSPDVATNHKFFNFFLALTNLFIAGLLVNLWQRKRLGKVLAFILFLFLTLSGVLEFFPVVNDQKIEIRDRRSTSLGRWVAEETSPRAVFLTSTDIYHPVSLAGRMIFLGWPYFAWSAGSDTDSRGRLVEEIYRGSDKNLVCRKLLDNGIDYLVLEKRTEIEEYQENRDFFESQFIKKFDQPVGEVNYAVYEVASSCQINNKDYR